MVRHPILLSLNHLTALGREAASKFLYVDGERSGRADMAHLVQFATAWRLVRKTCGATTHAPARTAFGSSYSLPLPSWAAAGPPEFRRSPLPFLPLHLRQHRFPQSPSLRQMLPYCSALRRYSSPPSRVLP